MKRKLVLVLDVRHPIERQTGELSHDGGKLLRMLIARLSIDRQDWVHTYCYQGRKEDSPGKKKERLGMMVPDLKKVDKFIDLNRPCVVVGMGGISCEFLTGASLVSRRAGTCWSNAKHGRVWITYSPEAALFDPGLAVSIYGVLANAAKTAGIMTQFNPKVKMFDWQAYERHYK